MTKKENIIRILVCLLIVSTLSFSNLNSSAKAASPVIDSYISVSSVSKNASNGTISVQYKVKKTIPSQVGICIGYEWPSTYRQSSAYNYCKGISQKAGTYTITIPKPSLNIIGTQNVVAKISGRYNETKSLKSVFNYPTGKKTTYHEVSKADALAEYMVIGGLGVGVKYMKNNAIGFVTKVAYSGYTTYYGLKGIGVLSGFPPKAVGQYYKVETWYNNNGLNIKTTIWASKAAFKDNHKALYTGTATTTW